MAQGEEGSWWEPREAGRATNTHRSLCFGYLAGTDLTAVTVTATVLFIIRDS